jgi:hypothetical protein
VTKHVGEEESKLAELLVEILKADATISRITAARHATDLKELLPLVCPNILLDFSQFTRCTYCSGDLVNCGCLMPHKNIDEQKIKNPFKD